jgi:hypothetical protein
MIANALRAEIDSYAAQMRRSNPMFSKAEDGTFTPAHLTTYLSNIYELVKHTPIFLVRARDRACEFGDDRLAAHYDAKRGEEQGHDAWAERDIASIAPVSSTTLSPRTAPSMKNLLEYLRETIDRDPTLYLAYILFAEYLTVLLGDEWLGLLEANCGIPRSSVSVVGNHVDLDKEHVEHALDEIDDLVGDPRKLSAMRGVLHESFALFDRFCAEVTQERNSGSWVAADAGRQTSAA